MSSKSKFIQSKASPTYRTQEMIDAKKVRDAEKNKNSKNHVSVSDLSPGGLPFHFVGPKKRDLTSAQKNERNVLKRMRRAD